MTDVLPGSPPAELSQLEASHWPKLLAGMAFGGDYNPEQWSSDVWPQDRQLMRSAGVNLATVGVFSWASLEPRPGCYEFEWMDDVIDGLHGAGIQVCLATPTAGPPAWLATNAPESLPVTVEGIRLGIGSRESFCPNSIAYRAAALNIAEQLAGRYGRHPALALWHVGNEFGSHVGACYCDVCAGAFVSWLQRRYGKLDSLNEAWGTSFWGQRYGEWDQITPPRRAPMPVNPSQQLDYRRFSSGSHLACYLAERDAIRPLSGVPITTNFMSSNCDNLDYWTWAAEVDVISNNHYLVADDPDNYIDLALSADLTRGLAGGAPWLLMETSTSAVNWQPRNVAKAPGELRRNIFSHIARGADGAMFFQWRASRFGAEKFHSAMLPQSGTQSRVWAEVVALGAELGLLEEVRGSRVASETALIWDWQSMWALQMEFKPSVDLDYRDRVRAFYEALWREQRTCDLVAPTADLSSYSLLVVPSLYLVTPEAVDNIRRYVEGGGKVVVSFFSGIVDAHDTVYPGAYPGALRDILGLWIDEFHPLQKRARVALSGRLTGGVWSEAVVTQSAEVIERFADGPDAGGPALTRNRLGRGEAWYVATALDSADLRRVLALVDGGPSKSLRAAEVTNDVECVRRVGADASYLFAINHGTAPVAIAVNGTDLLSGIQHHGELSVPGGGVAVIREQR